MEKGINGKFAEHLAGLRNNLKITQAKLAEKSGLSVEYISRLERGISSPSLQTLEMISKALGLKIKDLVVFSEDEDDRRIEVEKMTVLLTDKDGKTIRKVYRLSEDSEDKEE